MVKLCVNCYLTNSLSQSVDIYQIPSVWWSGVDFYDLEKTDNNAGATLTKGTELITLQCTNRNGSGIGIKNTTPFDSTGKSKCIFLYSSVLTAQAGSNTTQMRVLFYDTNNSLISYEVYENITTKSDQKAELTLPSGTCYIDIDLNNVNTASLSIKQWWFE